MLPRDTQTTSNELDFSTDGRNNCNGNPPIETSLLIGPVPNKLSATIFGRMVRVLDREAVNTIFGRVVRVLDRGAVNKQPDQILVSPEQRMYYDVGYQRDPSARRKSR